MKLIYFLIFLTGLALTLNKNINARLRKGFIIIASLLAGQTFCK